MNVRNRLVNFRVTAEELERLKTASSLQNARCLSEFARDVILESACDAGRALASGDAVAGQLLSFDRRLSRIESTVERLANTVEAAGTLAVKSER
jgi:hypothetical protein